MKKKKPSKIKNTKRMLKKKKRNYKYMKHF